MHTLQWNSFRKQTVVCCCNALIGRPTWKQWCNGLPEPISDHKASVAHDVLLPEGGNTPAPAGNRTRIPVGQSPISVADGGINWR